MIKSRVSKKLADTEPMYPCLKESSEESDVGGGNDIVLFIGPNRGFVVCSSSNYQIGEYHEDWVETYFKPFHGIVSLSND